VYPDFLDEPDSEFSTVVPDCEPPIGYVLVEGYDFGHADPTVVSFYAIAPDLSEVILYDEYYKGQSTVNYHSKEIYAIRYKHGVMGNPRWSFGDPSAAGTIAEFKQRGINIVRGFNNREVGIDIVQSFLERDGHGKQKLKVCERCVNHRREYKLYHYPEGGGDNPVDKDDHSPDSSRYGLASAVILMRRGISSHRRPTGNRRKSATRPGSGREVAASIKT
jgi:phage terminase large subunit